MALAKHTITGIVDDYPENILTHPVLGQYLEPYSPEDEEEQDKVVLGEESSKRVYIKSDVSAEDAPTTTKESSVTKKAGE